MSFVSVSLSSFSHTGHVQIPRPLNLRARTDTRGPRLSFVCHPLGGARVLGGWPVGFEQVGSGSVARAPNLELGCSLNSGVASKSDQSKHTTVSVPVH